MLRSNNNNIFFIEVIENNLPIYKILVCQKVFMIESTAVAYILCYIYFPEIMSRHFL